VLAAYPVQVMSAEVQRINDVRLYTPPNPNERYTQANTVHVVYTNFLDGVTAPLYTAWNTQGPNNHGQPTDNAVLAALKGAYGNGNHEPHSAEALFTAFGNDDDMGPKDARIRVLKRKLQGVYGPVRSHFALAYFLVTTRLRSGAGLPQGPTKKIGWLSVADNRGDGPTNMGSSGAGTHSEQRIMVSPSLVEVQPVAGPRLLPETRTEWLSSRRQRGATCF
jgi:hypothetical protein